MSLTMLSSDVTVNKVERRYPMQDQIGIISRKALLAMTFHAAALRFSKGGTLGLYTGFSLLSSIEILYWFYVALVKLK